MYMHVDQTLPFDLQSVALIFTAVADTLVWLMKQKGLSLVNHYLDNFIMLRRPRSDECANNFQHMLNTCGSREVRTPYDEANILRHRNRLNAIGDVTSCR